MGDLMKVIDIWLEGRSTLGETLWGTSMVTWGRIGKITAYLATMVVILDLVGATRLQGLRDRIGEAHALFKWHEVSSRFSTPPSEEAGHQEPEVAEDTFFDSKFYFWAMVYVAASVVLALPAPLWQKAILFAVWAGSALLLRKYLPWNWVQIGLVILLLPLLPLLTAAGMMLLFFLGTVLTWVVLRALGGDGYGHPVRVVAVIIGSLGFFMDLLAT